ncbi:hypothetical protein ISCGN_016318 [Ixodes scapularis]
MNVRSQAGTGIGKPQSRKSYPFTTPTNTLRFSSPGNGERVQNRQGRTARFSNSRRERVVCGSRGSQEAAIAIFFPLVGGLFFTAVEIWNGPVSSIQKGEPQFGVGRLQHRSSAIVFSAFKEMVAGVGLLAASLAVGISVPPHVVPAHRDHGTGKDERRARYSQLTAKVARGSQFDDSDQRALSKCATGACAVASDELRGCPGLPAAAAATLARHHGVAAPARRAPTSPRRMQSGPAPRRVSAPRAPAAVTQPDKR